MANRHFGKLADVWKHLPLAEIVAIERPEHYCETHAGSASYDMIDDAERRFGVLRFLDAAQTEAVLAASQYVQHLRTFEDGDGSLRTYPGSALLAMRELQDDASYLLCDLDPDSAASLKMQVDRLGVREARCVAADGMTEVHGYVTDASGTVLVHIDPFDPDAVGPSGLSALDLAAQLVRDGVGLVYWYGHDRAEESSWAFDALVQRAPSATGIWCGDVTIVSPDHDSSVVGDLGEATTPGTGFGIVCANLSAAAVDACDRLGHALERAYRHATLPDGTRGGIEFTSVWRHHPPPPADAVLHLTTESAWVDALETGEYSQSTRTSTVDEVGFVHCSFPDQIERTANLHYDDMAEIIVLRIDPARCPAGSLRVEEADGQFAGRFPHLYGPVPLRAVAEMWRWRRGDGSYSLEEMWP